VTTSIRDGLTTLAPDVYTPEFVAAETAVGETTTSVTVDVPAGVVDGDVLIWSVNVRDDIVVTNPTGWGTPLVEIATGGGPGIRLLVYGRIASSEPASYTITADNTGRWSTAMVAYAAGPGAVIGTYAELGAEDDLEVEAFGPGYQTMWLYVGAGRSALSNTWTAPVGMTERADISAAAGSGRTSVVVAEYLAPAVPSISETWTATPTESLDFEAAAAVYIQAAPQFDGAAWPAHPNRQTHISYHAYDGDWEGVVGWNGAVLFLQGDLGSGDVWTLADPTDTAEEAASSVLGLNTLGPLAAGWVDLTLWLRELTLTRGATTDDGVLTRYEAGQLECQFHAWDGILDPLNPDSPYADRLGVGCGLRLVCLSRSTLETLTPDTSPLDLNDYALFTGVANAWDIDGFSSEDYTATVVAADATADLQGADLPAQTPVGAGDDLTGRINRILLEAGWDPDEIAARLIIENPAAYNPTYAATDLAGPAWEQIVEVADAANRAAFIDGANNVCVVPYDPDSLDDTGRFDIGWQGVTWGEAAGDILPVDVEIVNNDDQLRNEVVVARTGGPTFTYRDEGSIARNRNRTPATWQKTDLPVDNDGDVETFGRFVLAQSSEQRPHITGMSVVPQILGPMPLEVTVDTFEPDGTPIETNAIADLWDLLFQLVSILNLWYWERHRVTVTTARGREFSQTVAVRGAEMRVDGDVWEFRFVTSDISRWFDIFTLADPSDSLEEAEQSRLNRGHRLG
jgi:hypothetical protein